MLAAYKLADWSEAGNVSIQNLECCIRSGRRWDSQSLGLMGACAPMPPTAPGSRNSMGPGQAKAIAPGNLLPSSLWVTASFLKPWHHMRMCMQDFYTQKTDFFLFFHIFYLWFDSHFSF